ncbi:MAG: hypothetical protein RL757_1456 [Bacteroidota bacterium]|jgi:translation initiation factor 1
MSKGNENKKKRVGVVFSTNPDFEFQLEPEETTEDLPPQQQKLRLHLERLKGNKEATIVRGWVGATETLEALGKMLKNKCGVGGAVKDNEILLQGNHRDKVLELLKKEGFSQTKKAGG